MTIDESFISNEGKTHGLTSIAFVTDGPRAIPAKMYPNMVGIRKSVHNTLNTKAQQKRYTTSYNTQKRNKN